MVIRNVVPRASLGSQFARSQHSWALTFRQRKHGPELPQNDGVVPMHHAPVAMGLRQCPHLYRSFLSVFETRDSWWNQPVYFSSASALSLSAIITNIHWILIRGVGGGGGATGPATLQSLILFDCE